MFRYNGRNFDLAISSYFRQVIADRGGYKLEKYHIPRVFLLEKESLTP